MLFQVLQSQTVYMATEHFGAVQSPDELGRRVEMADAKIVIDDHHGLSRPLKCRQQEIRGFDHGVVVCAHRPIPMPVWRPPRLDPGGEAPCWRKTYRSEGVKRVVRPPTARRKNINLKDSLPSSAAGANEWQGRHRKAGLLAQSGHSPKRPSPLSDRRGHSKSLHAYAYRMIVTRTRAFGIIVILSQSDFNLVCCPPRRRPQTPYRLGVTSA